MTIHPITCDEFADRLADFLERDVDERIRTDVESHALGCADCGALLADLRTLRIDAANLPVLTPARDLWAGIAARIETPVIDMPVSGERPATRAQRVPRLVRRWLPVSAAAAALVAVSVGGTYYAMTHGRASAAPAQRVASTAQPATRPLAAPSRDSVAAPSVPASGASSSSMTSATKATSAPFTANRSLRLASTATSKPSADEIYGREIARLRTIVAQRRSGLDTATIAVIEKNLQVIDDAIAQCRAALARDPASRYLLQSLNSALETKIELLRTAAQLPAHT